MPESIKCPECGSGKFTKWFIHCDSIQYLGSIYPDHGFEGDPTGKVYEDAFDVDDAHRSNNTVFCYNCDTEFTLKGGRLERSDS